MRLRWRSRTGTYAKVGDGFGLRKVTGWRAELPWLGKDGLIIFDQNGWGKDQAELRKSGYSVVGSSEGGDKLEFSDIYGHVAL